VICITIQVEPKWNTARSPIDFYFSESVFQMRLKIERAEEILLQWSSSIACEV
jgi:hypothetical protein